MRINKRNIGLLLMILVSFSVIANGLKMQVHEKEIKDEQIQHDKKSLLDENNHKSTE